MDADAVAGVLVQRKTVTVWTGWEERGNHSGNLLNVATLLDGSGVTIPGLTVELEVKANSTVISCFYLFTLMQSRVRPRSRVFQVEVVPAWKRSHVGQSVIYGPHEHMLEDEPTPVVHPSVNCESWTLCMEWFLARTGIASTEVKDPFSL